MATTTALTSELEAINIMLDCIGEAPVSSLATSGLEDVAKARACLDEISREVQQKDWGFNYEVDYPLLRAVDGTITVPSNTLEVSLTEPRTDMDITLRGTRLYDKKNHTFTFTDDIDVNIKFLLEWSDLPQAARNYIAIRAARVFQGRSFGSDTKHKFSEDQEFMALTNLKNTNGRQENYNMLSGSYSAFSVIER